jgi:hypothetical protein
VAECTVQSSPLVAVNDTDGKNRPGYDPGLFSGYGFWTASCGGEELVVGVVVGGGVVVAVVAGVATGATARGA